MGERISIRQHSLLQSQGGAARIAEDLCAEATGSGHECLRTWEISDRRGTGGDGLRLSIAETPDGFCEDVVHVHSTGDWTACLDALKGRPAVITMHDTGLVTGGCVNPLGCEAWLTGCLDKCPQGYQNARQRAEKIRGALSDLSPMLVSPSSWLARMAAEALPGSACRVAPNGTAWPDRPVDKRQAKAGLGIPDRAPVVMFAAHGGRRAGLKGGAHWEALWRDIKVHVPAAVGFFVGGERFGRENDLVVWPYLSRKDLAMVMSAADLLCYPSPADNHPLMVLEAFACGVAVAAYAVGGIPEQITDGRNGFLIRPGDMASMGRACVKALSRPSLTRKMGREAYLHGRERFSTRRMAADYLVLYRAAQRRAKGLCDLGPSGVSVAKTKEL